MDLVQMMETELQRVQEAIDALLPAIDRLLADLDDLGTVASTGDVENAADTLRRALEQ